MSNTDKRKALGRGLAALIPGAGSPPSQQSAAHAVLSREFFECAIEDLYPSDDNPRHVFDDQKLVELSESIRNQGLVQPLVVRVREGGGYHIVAGERRWRAAQKAGLRAVPVVVKEVTLKDAFELMLVENLQREDLNPIEEAEAYQRLVTDHGYTQEKLADRVGKERSTVTNALRLLKLPGNVRAMVGAGRLSMGHARALLGLEDGASMERAAERVIARQMSVRQTEQLVRKERSPAVVEDKKGPQTVPPSAAVRDLEQRLERALATRVRVAQKDPQRGTIEIEYHSLDQLDTLLEKMLRR
ncbi:MAG: ParB/RepB/Spo0J family partition protein [Polyangia bacterium]